ncbi:MAG: chloride channel protein [Phycisphaeraceae bacterium]|nr:chloride channel protein [Phycisphaeraceae bacterium]
MAESRAHSLARVLARMGFERDWHLVFIGAGVGVVTGLGAVGFDEALVWSRDKVAWAGEHLGLWIILLVPLIGMALTGVLVHRFASEARGHGVPQVMAALIQKGGVIPARIGIVKVIASIFTVASGGSAGTEGPIVQIGATAGSVAGRRLKIPREHLRTLVGCGAAAGISAIFNAPIAGVFFVLEILLRDFSLRTFSPIVISSVFSAVTMQALRGANNPIFPVGQGLHEASFGAAELPSYLLLGAVCGLIAVGFNRMLHACEDIYARVRLHPVLKPVSGAALLIVVGGATLLLSRAAGAAGTPAEVPAVFGNGYDIIGNLLDPTSFLPGESLVPTALWFLALLVVLKGIATTLTLGSGGSGGVFAPSLFLGATAGAAVGVGLEHLSLMPDGSSPAAYALVGMAAVVAGSTHAPLTAILILFELTRNIYVMLPIMLAAIVATGVAQLIERDSIYTYKLRRMGLAIGLAGDFSLLRRITAGSCPTTPLPDERIYASDPLSKLITLHATHNVPDFVVVDQDGVYMGMVTGADIRTALIDREAIPLLLVAELLRSDLPTVSPDETLDTVMDKFARFEVASLGMVTSARKPLAILSRSQVMKRYQEELDRS